jgi:hypothetical protein
VHDGSVTVLHARHYEPPLGMCGLAVPTRRATAFAFAPGDMLVLYTDGVIEARSPAGEFYPLAERLTTFPATSPDTLLRHIHDDLLAHIGRNPGGRHRAAGDRAAALAAPDDARRPAPQPARAAPAPGFVLHRPHPLTAARGR